MFNELLIKLRKEKGVTQKELASLLNVSDKSISRWENGNSLPTLEMMYYISKVFNVPLNSLIAVRVDTEKGDEAYKAIIKELSEFNNKKLKITKIILLISILISLVLFVAIIFTHTYNRFKVYTVYFENSDFIKSTGTYVETRVKDILDIGDIKIKGLTLSEKDTISVDLYIVDNDEEIILNNFSSLNDIYFVGYESYVPTGDLSDYQDNIYLRVKIINTKNELKEYISKLELTINFTNNKIFYNDDKVESNSSAENEIPKDKIIDTLIMNDFKQESEYIFKKINKKYEITYFSDSNIIYIAFKENNLIYNYKYSINNKRLDVRVYDKNSIDIQKYIYDAKSKKVIECITGTCNSYKYAMEIINDNFLKLLENN